MTLVLQKKLGHVFFCRGLGLFRVARAVLHLLVWSFACYMLAQDMTHFLLHAVT